MDCHGGGYYHCEEQFGHSIRKKEEDIKQNTSGGGTGLKDEIRVGNTRS